MEEAARAYQRQIGGGNVMESGGGYDEERGMMGGGMGGMGGMGGGMGGMGRGMMGPMGKFVLKAKGLPFRASQIEIAEV